MRALFLFFVLANVLFLAWSRYFSPADATVDPAPLARQVDPDKLRVLRPGETPAAALKTAPQAAAAAQPPSSAASAPAAALVQNACMEWGSFTLTDAPKAEQALQTLSLGTRLSQRRTEELAGWWVFIPPQSTRQSAVKKAAELKSLGVDEFFVVNEEGPFRWAVSLGVFRNEDAAQARLKALRGQGVRSAQIRPRETMVPKVWLQVKDVDAGTEARLREIARQIEGSELRPCS
jgi:hypothetical protein